MSKAFFRPSFWLDFNNGVLFWGNVFSFTFYKHWVLVFQLENLGIVFPFITRSFK